ncbi:MAG: hypothetical protein ACRD59_05465, partial [Candidatus Acidiferrales bacterium]
MDDAEIVGDSVAEMFPAPLVSREKSAANHIPRRIPFARNVKEFLGFSKSRSITGKFTGNLRISG